MTWRLWVVRQFRRRLGIEIRRVDDWPSPVPLLEGLLPALQVRHVIDVGANEGQFVEVVREAGFAGRIDSYEPSPQTYRRLVARLGQDPAWYAHNGAATDRPGELTLHLFENSVFDSVNSPSAEGRAAFSLAAHESVTVDAVRLDDEPLPDLGPTFLKVDTQGHDWQVLAGAEKVLTRTVLLSVEMSFAPLYEHVEPAWVTLERLDGAGWGCVGIYPVSRASDLLRVGDADGLFVRKDQARSLVGFFRRGNS